jgi:hypothetical protein
LLQSNTGRKSAEYPRAPTDRHFLMATSLLPGDGLMSNRRIFTFCASVFVIAVSGSVFAADMAVKMPVKAPPSPLPAPILSWTGFYIGGALGGKWADTTWTTTSNSDFPGTTTDASSPRNFDPSSFRAGGYAGYNWQITTWVVGLEGDVAWANDTSTAAGIPGCTIECFPGAPGLASTFCP